MDETEPSDPLAAMAVGMAKPSIDYRRKRSEAGEKAAASRWEKHAVSCDDDAIRCDSDATLCDDDAIQCVDMPKKKKENIKDKKENKKDILSGTISHIVDHLNEKAGTNFRDQSKSTRQHIHARLDEGFTEADFYTVIDKKVEEWKGTDMAKYLRPETLFGSKFEGYLNQTRAAPAKVSNFTPRDQNLDDEVYRLGLFANL